MFRPGRDDAHHFPIAWISFLEGLIALHIYAAIYLRSHPHQLPWQSGGAYKLLFVAAMIVFYIPNAFIMKDRGFYNTPYDISKPLRLTLAILSWICFVVLSIALLTADLSLLKRK